MAMNDSFQMMCLQSQINQLQNQINQMQINPNNQIQFNNLQMQILSLQNQLNILRLQQMNQINNPNQMNNINLNNMVNLNNNINNMNPQQPFFISNNIPIPSLPIGIPQNGFSQENDYTLIFDIPSGTKIVCYVSADKSIKEMIQIFINKVGIEQEDLKDIVFLFNSKKIDINSEEKIKELFGSSLNPRILFVWPNPPTKITFNSTFGIKTIVRFRGCLCCTRFWDLLKVYLDKIGLDENCLKDLKFIFNGNILPNSKNKAMKYSSTKYGIQAGSIITVIDTKNIIGKK
jgi:hypothetical protein